MTTMNVNYFVNIILLVLRDLPIQKIFMRGAKKRKICIHMYTQEEISLTTTKFSETFF